MSISTFIDNNLISSIHKAIIYFPAKKPMVVAPKCKCVSASGSKPSEKVVKSKISKAPYLRWGKDDTKGILFSGLSPLRMTRISLLDEPESKKISLIIEPLCPGKAMVAGALLVLPLIPIIFSVTVALGYFFEKNIETEIINMHHRIKPFNGKEKVEVYRNSTYLKLTNIKGETPVAHIGLVNICMYTYIYIYIYV
jgi:hypothetical protein